jgi:hypothetical protein
MKRRIVLVILGLAFAVAFFASYEFLGYNPTPTHSDTNIDPGYLYCNNSLELVTTGWEHPGGDALPLDDKALIADCIEQAQAPARIGLSIAAFGLIVAIAWVVVFVRGRRARKPVARSTGVS